MVAVGAVFDLWHSTHRDDMSLNEKIILGIDIGTTSVKTCVVRISTGEVLAKTGKDTQSYVPSDQGIEGNKQDVKKIISALNSCIARLQKNILQRVTEVGICGQMHGVVLWNNRNGNKAWERIEKDNHLVRYDVVQDEVSALYTWQDNRCDQEFLASLPVPDSHLNVYTGFGTATLFWMTKNKPDELKKYNCAGTIQDFVVAMLCNLDKPIISDQNAASWGYFNCLQKKWNTDLLAEANFPIDLLPDIKNSCSIAGCLEDNWHSIRKGVPIGVALGDLQCSVLSKIQYARDAVLNISTSAQIAFVAEQFKATNGPPMTSTVEYIPYFKSKYLAVASSLNGGNALATFIKMLQQWAMELGHSVPQSKVWDIVMERGLEESAVSDLKITPTCLGERHHPNMTASVTNINIGNICLGKVFRALCSGIISNMHSMMPKEFLKEAEINRIVGNGSGLSRNKVLQNEIQRVYQLPLVFSEGGDAAIGAALAMNLPHD